MLGLMLFVVCSEPSPQYIVENKLTTTYVVTSRIPTSRSVRSNTVTESYLTVDMKQQTYTLSVTQSGGCVGGVCYPPSRPGLFQRLRR